MSSASDRDFERVVTGKFNCPLDVALIGASRYEQGPVFRLAVSEEDPPRSLVGTIRRDE